MTSPPGKNRLNIPNMMGNIQTIMRWVDAWVGSALRTCIMRCCTNMVTPDSATRPSPRILRSLDGSTARSMPKKPRPTGTAESSTGSQE